MISRLLATLRAPGWRRVVLLRRAAALTLMALAIALALRPQGTPALFFTTEVSAGQEITAEHIEVRRAAHAPASVLTDPGGALGKVLIAPAVAGEPVTPTRLLSPEVLNGHVAVPVPLSAPENVLHHGDVVSVVAQGDQVIATGAKVLLPPGPDSSTALLSLPEESAARVAAAALSTPLTVLLTTVGYSSPHTVP
ncbi:SAF domain-containing protein [Corynebacterium mastitidis]|uniref:SAF domain-containing protein n=1 Tax=Corynebacterium mastitidis TaxID=161890 RepID=A0ABU8P1Q6_9CORY